MKWAVLARALIATILIAGCATPTIEPQASAPSEPAAPPAPPPPPQPPPAPPSATPPAEARQWNVTGSFTVRDSRLELAPDDQEPAGREAAPVELASPPADARTRLHRDHWVLALEIVEAGPDLVLDGNYTITLTWDGAMAGALHVTQRENQAGIEGVLARFDLGAAIERSAAYSVVVERTPAAAAPPLVVVSNPTGNLTWVGTGEAEGRINPALSVAAGTTVRIVARNADDVPHNLAVMDANGRVVAGPSSRIDDAGDEAGIEWLPTVPGRYEYVCLFHPTTMRGPLVVS